MFQIGDKIVYPMHGAGVIVGIEQKTILGEAHNYYVMQLSVSSMRVMLPTNNTDAIGVRDIVSPGTADKVIEYFRTCDEETEQSWNRRYRENIDKMKRGNLFDIALIAKTLTLRDRRRALSNAERKMLLNAKSILISELVLAKQSTYEDMETLLMSEI